MKLQCDTFYWSATIILKLVQGRSLVLADARSHLSTFSSFLALDLGFGVGGGRGAFCFWPQLAGRTVTWRSWRRERRGEERIPQTSVQRRLAAASRICTCSPRIPPHGPLPLHSLAAPLSLPRARCIPISDGAIYLMPLPIVAHFTP